jgi:tRNA(Ile)-lysidine synthase
VLKQFEAFVDKHHMCNREGKVILAVSGGLDSMVMLDLFVKSRFKVVVAHVNFQLRAAESDRDESFVREHCQRLGIPFHSKAVETNNYAMQHKLSIQMAARRLRYDWFAELIGAGVGKTLATAHHLNDNIETVLLNLVRGGGSESLTGIRLLNGHVIRPMMFATRREIEQYAASNGLLWREDESNQTSDYQRNFVRHQLIPLMEQINPSLEEAWRRTIHKAHGDQELADRAIGEWKRQHMSASGSKIFLNIDGVSRLQHPLSLLLRILEPYGFNYSHCCDILDALHGQAGKTFLTASHQLVVDREKLILTVLPEKLKPVNIASGDDISAMGPFHLTIGERQGNAFDADPAIAILDKDKVSFPLQWRTWKEGDYFFPLGMKGKKKVSDFLVDLKLSIPEKQSVTVIESNDGIVWLPGLRIDDRFKVTDQTRTSLVLRLGSQLH